MKIYVPCDAGALALGADAVAMGERKDIGVAGRGGIRPTELRPIGGVSRGGE